MAPTLSSFAAGCFSIFRRRFRLPAALLRLSASATYTSNPSPPKPHFIAEYLQTQYGLSSAEAAKASKLLSHLKSLLKPDSFMGFMRDHGFSDAQLKKIIICRPAFLCMRVEKTLKPKLQSLQDLGFSSPDITLIIASNPDIMAANFDRTLLPNIKFWQGLFGPDKQLLMKHLRTNSMFQTRSLEKRVMANVSLLRECGIADQKTVLVMNKYPRFIFQQREALTALIERAEGLGSSRGSGMFLWALYALFSTTKAKFDACLQVMTSFGWSQAEFLSAFCKAPVFLTNSLKLLQQKMEFLVKDAGHEPSEVAGYPVLLMFSLERRLVPRHNVMKMLKSRGLLERDCKLLSIMNYTEKKFLGKYVIPFKEKVPELQKILLA